MQLRAREMSPPIHVTEESEAIKERPVFSALAPGKLWGSEKEMGREAKEGMAAGEGGRRASQGKAPVFWHTVGTPEVFVECINAVWSATCHPGPALQNPWTPCSSSGDRPCLWLTAEALCRNCLWLKGAACPLSMGASTPWLSPMGGERPNPFVLI